MRFTKWDRTSILREIRKAHREGLELSYNATARRNQALISACNYHYKGYRAAVEMAGLNYAQIIRKPWWTPPWVIRTIRQAKRAGEDLSWRVVSRRRDAMGHCAIAAVRPRLFGSWDKALEASGVDSEKVRRYQGWAKDRCLSVLRKRSKDGEPVNSASIQHDIPGLYGAIIRHFGTFDAALVEAGVDPTLVRQRRVWTPAEVLRQLAMFRDTHGDVTPTLLRKHDYSLQKAVVATFGSVDAAFKRLGKTTVNKAVSTAGRINVAVGTAPKVARVRPAPPGVRVNGSVDARGRVRFERRVTSVRRVNRTPSKAS